jgi:hypothetical protein
MRELAASAIMDVWEGAGGKTLAERALDLLAAGGVPEPYELLSVGRRDALLINLHELTFGAALEAVVACPSCAELLEVALESGDLAGERTEPSVGPIELDVNGQQARFRPPSAADLVAAARAATVDDGRAILLARCVDEPDGPLTPELEAAIVDRMAKADPGAWIELALACPACGNRWNAPFDIVSFLWAELDACARRLVRDVHALASAYGWRERDVLALSPARREAYLELAGA